MRWTRPLLLLGILAILGAVGFTYYGRLERQRREAPSKPHPLAPGTDSAATDWTYTQTAHGKPVVFVRAKDFKAVQNNYDLTGVELHIFHKDGAEYDQVKSAKAAFDINQGLLFSEGDVEITMGVEAGKPQKGRLMTIKSSGVRFESKTGKAATDRPTTFSFDQGEGKAMGAAYDPQTRELVMHSGVQLVWRGKNPQAKPMKVEAGDLIYKEREAKVYLGQWSRFTRDTMTLNAGPAVVKLADGLIQQVDTEKAQGVDARPGRNLTYAADALILNLDDDGQIQKITGEKNARLVSTADTAETTITTDRVDMAFVVADKDSTLDFSTATGHSVIESKPITKAGADAAETRVLKSDIIRTKMRPGGQEIESMETDAAGSLEFIPNRAGQPHRWMNGAKLWMTYGPKNQLRSFKSVQVSTRTENAKGKDAPALTWSKELLAEFEPNSSQLAKLEQWNEFRYEEGPRKAKADRAVLDQAKNLIHLTGSARVWDQTGSADGDTIDLDQKNGDFFAEGHVNSTRLPDKKKDADSSSGGLLSEDEPLHARAKKMASRDNNLAIRYDGDALMWQGANRLQADTIEIDRDNEILKAHGHVVSQLLDKQDQDDKAPDGKKARTKDQSPVFTIVRAPDLLYKDEEKLAHYQGGVLLDRPNMKVKAREIRAFLRDSDNDSSLDHAFADGTVQIVQTGPDRTRTGTSEHAEYYVDDDKVILQGGQPQLVDSKKGTTRGAQLTWFSKDDRLLVNGAEGQPAKSKLRRK
jgi:lipopolysaccharide export system protein LptA